MILVHVWVGCKWWCDVGVGDNVGVNVGSGGIGWEEGNHSEDLLGGTRLSLGLNWV